MATSFASERRREAAKYHCGDVEASLDSITFGCAGNSLTQSSAVSCKLVRSHSVAEGECR
jgi:hypothetical protein